jgi:broad specificity phosphatase PhoE
MSRLMLVRHGEVAADMSCYWGRTDVHLSSEGLRQAERLRIRLAAEEIGVVYSSDLRRALDTAAIIAAPHRLSVVPCPELREIDFGQCEGLTYDEMMANHPGLESMWNALDPEISFPGGESLRALAERLDRFVSGMCCHLTNTALVVAHGGSLQVLICRLMGQNLSCWQQTHIKRASLSIVEVDGRGGALQLLNDVSHL